MTELAAPSRGADLGSPEPADAQEFQVCPDLAVHGSRFFLGVHDSRFLGDLSSHVTSILM